MCRLAFRNMGTVVRLTNLTGLAVCPNPKSVLKRIYKRITNLLVKMPENSAYRKYTQAIISQKLAIINSTEDVKVMQEKLGCGLIEEVIQQARMELELAEQFIVVKPWESLVVPIPKNQWKWPVK